MDIPELNNKDSRLLLESVKYKGGIVTGGECKVGCKYCYLRQSKKIAPLIPLNIPFISRNDFSKALLTAKKYSHRIVSLGDGVDLISSEPFIHPLIYDFIAELESLNYIDNICITTSGLYIREAKYDFLNRCKKIRWLISCSSLTEKGRENIVLTKDCKPLISFLSLLHDKKWRFINSIQLVTYSLRYFIEDIKIIKNRFPRFMPKTYITKLAYNKFFSAKAKRVIEHCKQEFNKVLRYCYKNKIPLCWHDSNMEEDFDLKYNFSCFQAHVDNLTNRINNCIIYSLKQNFKAPLLCIPESCFGIIPKIKGKIVLPNFKKGYLKVKNRTLGGTYTCYGLLTINDFIHALKRINLKDYDAVFLNGIFLNKDNLDLRRQHINELKRRIKLPVIIVNGAVNKYSFV